MRLGLLLACAVASGLPALAIGAPITLIDDKFVDGGSDNGTDALDTLWQPYGSGNNIASPLTKDSTTGPNEGSPDFFMRSNPNTNQARGVYGAWSPTTTLGLGDTLTLTFDLMQQTETAATAGIRFGLYDSLGTPSVNDDVGYAGRFSIATATAASATEESSGTDQPLTGGTVSALAGSGTGAVGVTTTSMRMGLTLERTALGIAGTLYQNGNSVFSFSDNTSPYTLFNEVFIGTGLISSSLNIDNVLVVYTPAVVPEPTSLFGAAIVSLVALKRRCRPLV